MEQLDGEDDESCFIITDLKHLCKHNSIQNEVYYVQIVYWFEGHIWHGCQEMQ